MAQKVILKSPLFNRDNYDKIMVVPVVSFLLETGSHYVILKLDLLARMASNSKIPCLCLPKAEIKGVPYHAVCVIKF